MNKQAAQRMNVPIGIAYDPEMHAALIRWENAGSKRLSPALQRQVQANLGWTGKQTADDLDLVELLMEQEAAQTQNMKTADTIQTLAKMAAEVQALALAKNSLLGAGLGTGLGYLKHRVGEYLSPSGSEHAPRLRSLQRQLGKPGKDQTQVKQQIARIQEQQDEARRSSRNRNLLGGAVAGGSLGAYFEHVNQTNKNTARADRKALQEQAFKSEQVAKATQEAKAKKDRAAAAWERSYKAKQETDDVLRELSKPGNNSTPSARSQKWFGENNTSTPEPVKSVEDKKKEIAATIAANEKRHKKDYLDEMAYHEHQNSLIRNSMKRHRNVMALDETVMEQPVYSDDSLPIKGLEAMYGLEPGMIPSESERKRALRDDLIRTNEQAIPKVLKERVSSMNKKSSIQGLAKMAACGDACRCGQTENECTCSDVEKLARLAAKQASSGAWTRAEGKSESGGLNAKGRASLKAQGQNIKPPVTEDKPTGERAGRKSSFCARMGGMKKKLTSSETANDPDSRINKALRKWRC